MTGTFPPSVMGMQRVNVTVGQRSMFMYYANYSGNATIQLTALSLPPGATFTNSNDTWILDWTPVNLTAYHIQ